MKPKELSDKIEDSRKSFVLNRMGPNYEHAHKVLHEMSDHETSKLTHFEFILKPKIEKICLELGYPKKEVENFCLAFGPD